MSCWYHACSEVAAKRQWSHTNKEEVLCRCHALHPKTAVKRPIDGPATQPLQARKAPRVAPTRQEKVVTDTAPHGQPLSAQRVILLPSCIRLVSHPESCCFEWPGDSITNATALPCTAPHDRASSSPQSMIL